MLNNSTLSIEPFDPRLSSLSSELAFQAMAARYITVAALAIFIWEILINISNDCYLLFERRLRLPTVVYFISRLGCLGFTVSTTVQRVESTFSNLTCVRFYRLTVVLYCVVLVFTSLLFLFRTRAVFRDSWVAAFFSGLWLAVLGVSLAFIIVIFRPERGTSATAICLDPGVNSYISATIIIPLINDSLAFLAISWRLFRNSYVPPTLNSGIRFLIFGEKLPVFSKAFFQDGQAYYLTIVTANIISVIMLYIPSNPAVLQTIFQVPNIVLMNVMAGRVFSNTIICTETEEI